MRHLVLVAVRHMVDLLSGNCERTVCVFSLCVMGGWVGVVPAACGDMKPPRLMTAVCWFPKFGSGP